ncbi:MAG: DNA adenine methylase, partial [Planctomycetes bacterium]|nr:DNA adenine methylase [Planctomycetota bacterium]
EELATVLQLTPYSFSEFGHCRDTLAEGDALERARKFGVVARQCRAGNRGQPSWSRSITHSRREMASGNSRWLHLPEGVWQMRDRLASVQIDCLDAIECIKRYDRPGTVFYCDPPYHPDTRKTGAYRHEYTHEQHVELLDVLQGIKGKAVLSGYDCDLYRERLSDWGRVEREVPCRSNVKGNGEIADRPTRQEVLWIKNGAGQ